jgi:putative DNA primase/helicase
LPIEFDPKATCPATDKFDSQVFPQDAIILSHEIAAVLLHPGLRIQKAILFLGEGGAGKSRKLNQYKKFIGSSLCSAVSLHDLESNKFAPARLFGKLANICADLPSAHLAGTSIFKAITGGDTITAEDKFKTSFEFDCYAKLIFSANHPPRSQDASQALFDRWVVVPFQGRFRGTSEEIPQDELDALLTSPSELSGLLNHALACIDRLRRTARYSEPESVREAHREFHEATDPLAVWLNRFTVDDPEAKVPMGVLRSAYGAECEQHGRPALTKTAFGTQLKQLRPDIEDRKRTVNGRSQWCYVGLGFAADDEFSSKEVEPDNSPDTRPTGVTGVAPLVTTFYHASEDETTEGSKEAEGKSDNKWAESGNSGQSGNGNESSPSLAASDNGHCQCGRPWTPTVAPDGRKFNQCVPCDLIFPVREVEVQTSDFD